MGFRHQIGLVQQDDVGEGRLFPGLDAVFQIALQVDCVGYRNKRVQLKPGLDLIDNKERRSDRGGVRQTRRFDQHGIEFGAPGQIRQGPDQVLPNGTTQTTVIKFHQLLVILGDHQLSIYADLTELIDDNRHFVPVPTMQDMIEKGCFSRPQESRHYGNRNPLR